MPTMNDAVERIESADDPRVAAYRNLKDRPLRREGRFITEGRLLTVRLAESRFPVESVWVAEPFAQELADAVAGRAPVYVSSKSLMKEVAGFDFHRGVLGCGRRVAAATVDELMGPLAEADRVTLIVCPDVTYTDNLGGIFRVAAAFGVDGVILGERCCDAFSRRCLRLSMGAVLRVPIVQSADLSADLRRLREQWDVERMAAVLDASAEPLGQVRRARRLALLFGSEFDGLGPGWLAECDRRVTIPMAPGTDSLNLAVAAGIIVHEMTRPHPNGANCD